jgi:hypothetical protein
MATDTKAPLIQPLPWRVVEERLVDANGFTVLHGVTPDEAEFIVRAVNHHDELIAALQACSFQLGLLCLAHRDFSEASAKAIDASEAVLAKVRG